MRLSLPRASDANGDGAGTDLLGPSHDGLNRRACCLGVFDLEEGILEGGDDAGPGFPEGA
jgi:hypothetical protein